jgi:hypothetical protein
VAILERSGYLTRIIRVKDPLLEVKRIAVLGNILGPTVFWHDVLPAPPLRRRREDALPAERD